MKLHKLLSKLDIPFQNIDDFEIYSVEIDSRKCNQNSVFFAIKGVSLNGEDYIDAAIENGAKAVFVADSCSKSGAEIIKTSNIEDDLFRACEIFYADLPRDLIAVTGTNGKTSVANYIAQLISLMGGKSSAHGTLGVFLDGNSEKKLAETGLTTADVVSNHQILQQAKQQHGVDYAVMETSSHGIHQRRLGNLKFDISIFTSFTQDHLDYHKNMDEYFAAKADLFRHHTKESGIAIINSDLPNFDMLRQICTDKNIKFLSYGRDSEDFELLYFDSSEDGLNFAFEFQDKRYEVKTHLVGDFQVDNLLASIIAVCSLGFDLEDIIPHLFKVKPVSGRMEVIKNEEKKNRIIIDYAHTPDALEKAISSLQSNVKGKIITVFGCGGDRDASKRKLMGAVAKQLSDIVIITDDNPRNEDAESIRSEIKQACPDAIEMGDRAAAIKHAIEISQFYDVVLIAGKGHEDYQIIGAQKHHFSDREEVLRNIY